jgi:pyridoxal phosphate enzyme (YggS family)
MSIADNLKDIKDRITAASERAGRDPGKVKLVAVSKTVPAELVEEALLGGADMLGENYVQEARHKIAKIGRDRAQWHFIGHLQKNKAKYAVDLFDMVHSVDSVALAAELDKRAGKKGLLLPVLVQVNISGEDSKSGIDPDSVAGLVSEVSQMPNLSLKGLMTMPPYLPPEEARPYFVALRELRDSLERRLNIELPELSMGMTGDFEAAIEEGATLVRVGTGIFGERS